jgi:hypothetical protein
MDRREEGLEREGIAPEMGRVESRMQGRTLPVPPLIPSIAIIGLLFGLVVGFGMGTTVQKLTSWPTQGPVVTDPPATAEPLPSATPPSGGVTLQHALVSLHAAGWDLNSTSVSARVVPGSEVQSQSSLPDWVWVFTWQDACQPIVIRLPGESAPLSPEPTTPPCLESAVLDYWTGEYLFVFEPAPSW